MCALGLLALILAAPASAVSPQRIYADLADNGRLDGRYSRADLERALNVRRALGRDPRPKPNVRRPAAAGNKPAKESGARLPFTGLDLALLIVGGFPLLLLGLGVRLRRTGRNAARVEVVSS